MCGPLIFKTSLHSVIGYDSMIFEMVWDLFCAPKTLWLMLAIGPTGWFAFSLSGQLLCSLNFSLCFAPLSKRSGKPDKPPVVELVRSGLANLTVIGHRLSWCAGTDPERSHIDSRHSGIQWTVASRGVWSMQWSVRYFLDNSVKHQLPSSCSNYVAFTFEVHKGFQVGLKTHPSTKRAWGRFVWNVF